MQKSSMHKSSVSLMRPELVEIKSTIRNLKKEAEMRLTLDVEAQQSFDFLSDQVQGLRKAFSTLSDVLIEELDLIRCEATDRYSEMRQRNDALEKTLKAAKTEIMLLHTEAQTCKATLQSTKLGFDERIELLQDDMTILAHEVAKDGSARHLLQLDVVQLRSQMEDEAREWRAEQESQASKLHQVIERFDVHQHDARSSMQALDSDLGTIRARMEHYVGLHNDAIDASKDNFLHYGQALEKLWGSAKLQQQRLESVGSGGSLQYQQLQERLETINKQACTREQFNTFSHSNSCFAASTLAEHPGGDSQGCSCRSTFGPNAQSCHGNVDRQ